MVQISVIVPIYRVERYLKSCIHSILSQSFTNLELILVDDGSTDGSAFICDEYLTLDPRITVIHLLNGGVSLARNFGIELSSGNYIGFVDGDDYIDENMYETLNKVARNSKAEVIYCEARFIHSDGSTTPDEIQIIDEDKIYVKEEWTPDALRCIAGGVCHAMYSRTLIKSHHIMFPVDCTFSEDRVFNIYAMGYANKTYVKKSILYNIVLHEDSCIQRYHENHYEMTVTAKNKTRDAIREVWGNDEDYQNGVINWFVDNCIAGIRKMNLSGYPLFRKVKEVKKFCDDPELIDAINLVGYEDNYSFLIKNKFTFLLLFCEKRQIASRIWVLRRIKEYGFGKAISFLFKKQ